MVRKLPLPAAGDATRSKRIPSDAASTCASANAAVAVVGHALPFALANAAANFFWAFVTAPRRFSGAPLLVRAASRLEASPFRSNLDHALSAAAQNLAACFSLADKQSDVGSPLIFLASAGTAEQTIAAPSARVIDTRTTERDPIMGPPFPGR